MIITLTTTIAPVVTMSIPSTPCDSRRRAERKAARSAWRATPAALVLYLAEHLPAAWTVCAPPSPCAAVPTGLACYSATAPEWARVTP